MSEFRRRLIALAKTLYAFPVSRSDMYGEDTIGDPKRAPIGGEEIGTFYPPAKLDETRERRKRYPTWNQFLGLVMQNGGGVPASEVTNVGGIGDAVPTDGGDMGVVDL